jgi:hypothetical protein
MAPATCGKEMPSFDEIGRILPIVGARSDIVVCPFATIAVSPFIASAA